MGKSAKVNTACVTFVKRKTLFQSLRIAVIILLQQLGKVNELNSYFYDIREFIKEQEADERKF